MECQIKRSSVGHHVRIGTSTVTYILGFLLQGGLQLEFQFFNKVPKNKALVIILKKMLIMSGMHKVLSLGLALVAAQGFTCDANFTQIAYLHVSYGASVCARS